MIKLLIVDDHPLILDGSKKLFSEVSDISVDTLNDIETFANVIEEKVYDIFLIDVNLGACSGLTFAELVKEKYPSSIVILYTGDNIKDYYSLIIEKKINNVISKTAKKDQIIKTIYSCIDNQIVLPDNFINYVQSIVSINNQNLLRLNNREKRILELITKGYTNQAIALEMDVTQRTVEKILTQIYNLFEVGTRAEAVLKAKELNLI